VTRTLACALLAVAGCDAAPDRSGDAGATCADRWTIPVEAVVEGLVASADGSRVYAVGRADEAGWIGAIDACAGVATDARPAPPAGRLEAAVRVGPDLYAVGADAADAVVARFGDDLSPRWVTPLGEDGPTEGLADVVATSSGALWAVGEVTGDGPPRRLLVRVDAGGVACPIALEGARAIDAVADSVHVVATDGASATLHRFDDGACGGCGCAPVESSAAWALPAGTTVSALAVERDAAFVAGFSVTDGPAGAAYLARLEAGALAATARLDPTEGVAGFVDLALDGDLVLAVGASGWDGAPGFATAQGVLAAFATGFGEDEAPLVVIEPTDTRLITSVAVGAANPRFWMAGLRGEGRSTLLQCRREADGCEGATSGAWPVAPGVDAGAPSPDGGAPDAGVDAGAPPSAVPVIDRRDGRRLRRRGQPWYPTGYYPGAALNMTGPDFAGDHRAYNEALIERLASQQIDLFRVWINWGALTNASAPTDAQWDRFILTPYERTGPGDAVDGRPRLDLDRFSEAYFDEIEHAVAFAESRDVVVQVLLLDCWHAGFGRSFGFDALDYFAAGNNVNGVSFGSEAAWADVDGPVYARNVAFVEEVVRRIGHHENVIWETCNEARWVPYADPAASAAHPFHARLAEAIHAVEAAEGHPRHLVMPVDLPEHRTVAGHRTPAPSDAQSVDAFRAQLLDPQHGWGLPLISDNDCCPGEPDADLLRRKAWAALTAGAHLDVFNNEMFRRTVLEATNTTRGMRFVSMPGRLVTGRGVDLATMAPCDATATPARWCYGHADGERIVYVEGGGATALSGLPATVDAVWFDPRSGEITPAGAGPSFTAPDGRDWVLHVR